MGSDDLHRKRKARKANDLRRRAERRAPYDSVLIVCEGEKTEPGYFEEMRKFLGLSNANIKVCGEECGSSPSSVVDFALTTYRKEKNFFYDRVYCVFDRDQHARYNAALDKIKRVRLGNGSTIEAITSIPCFEYWLLLHYEYTTRYFVATGKNSGCAQVIKQLKKHLPNYQKGQSRTFEQTFSLLDTAIANAKAVEKYHLTSGTDTPSTRVHDLIGYLKKLSGKRRFKR